MTQSKHTIYFLSALCLIFLGLSYAISVNKELLLLYINSVWISYEFLYTICSGAFASMLVMIAAEIYKFIQTKRNVENYLFTLLLSLYEQLQIADTNIKDRLSKETEISGVLLNHLTHSIRQIAPQLRAIDYNPIFNFNRSRVIKSVINRYFLDNIFVIETLANDCAFLEIAINTDKMDHLCKDNQNSTVTSFSPKTNKTLITLQKRIALCKSQLHIDLTEVNASCCNRFRWNDLEQNILKVNIPDTSLENFWDSNKNE